MYFNVAKPNIRKRSGSHIPYGLIAVVHVFNDMEKSLNHERFDWGKTSGVACAKDLSV